MRERDQSEGDEEGMAVETGRMSEQSEGKGEMVERNVESGSCVCEYGYEADGCGDNRLATYYRHGLLL
jgi:hypothetical protein